MFIDPKTIEGDYAEGWQLYYHLFNSGSVEIDRQFTFPYNYERSKLFTDHVNALIERAKEEENA